MTKTASMTIGGGTTDLTPGDVVLVPLPFTDLSDAKLRPAVVVSSTYYNSVVDDIVVAGLTSQLRRTGDLHYHLADWQAAGLLKPTVVKPIVATIKKDIVRLVIGRVTERDLVGVQQVLNRVLELDGSAS